MIASIFAAGMSTISTGINSSSTVVLVDYFQRFSKQELSEKHSMRILYLTTFLISVIGIGIGFAMINVKSALDAWWKLASVFSGGMLGLFLLGAFVEKVSRKGAILGVIFGVIMILWMSVSPLIWTEGTMQAYASSFHSYLAIVFGTSVLFVTGFLVTVVVRK